MTLSEDRELSKTLPVRLNSNLYRSCRPYSTYAPHQLPRLRISGVISLHLLYAFVVYTGTTLPLYFTLMIVRRNHHFCLQVFFNADNTWLRVNALCKMVAYSNVEVNFLLTRQRLRARQGGQRKYHRKKSKG